VFLFTDALVKKIKVKFYLQFGIGLSLLCLPALMQKRICCGTCWLYHATCRQKGQNMTGKLLFSNHRKYNRTPEPPPRIWTKNWGQIKSSSVYLNKLQTTTSISI